MASTIIDSRIFGNIFGTDAMRGVWSDENRTALLRRDRKGAGGRPGPPRHHSAGSG